jgi:hypothetical protein
VCRDRRRIEHRQPWRDAAPLVGQRGLRAPVLVRLDAADLVRGRLVASSSAISMMPSSV